MAKQEAKKHEDTEEAAPLTQLDVLGEILFHVAGASQAIQRIADKVAPVDPRLSVGGRAHTKVCQRGHGMQATDDYCQHCYREDNPSPTRPGRQRAA